MINAKRLRELKDKGKYIYVLISSTVYHIPLSQARIILRDNDCEFINENGMHYIIECTDLYESQKEMPIVANKNIVIDDIVKDLKKIQAIDNFKDSIIKDIAEMLYYMGYRQMIIRELGE